MRSQSVSRRLSIDVLFLLNEFFHYIGTGSGVALSCSFTFLSQFEKKIVGYEFSLLTDRHILLFHVLAMKKNIIFISCIKVVPKVLTK